MIGLAKSAEPEVKAENKPQPQKVESKPRPFDSWEGIPMDMLRHYGVEVSSTDRKTFDDLRYITDFIKSSLPENERDSGAVMLKFRELERKLGSPMYGQKPHTKVYEYAKISKRINQLEQERQNL